MLTFSGFNGFGQFGTELERKLTTFHEFIVKLPAVSAQLLIAPSWCYTAIAADRHLRLQGFLSHKTHALLDVYTPAAVEQICVNDRFCLVLLNNGRVYKLLPQLAAELQEVKFAVEHVQPPQKRNIFGVCKSATQVRITHISCGANIAAAFSSDNGVYSIPSIIHQFPKHFRLRQLLCGFEHALLLSGNGDVYSWGNGLRGQLGQDVLRVEETPVLVEALAGIKITCIAAAGWHSAAISAFGDLYTWGFNSNGQLGIRLFKIGIQNIKQPTVYPLPQIIDLPKCCAKCESQEYASASTECNPLKVYAGARHTVVQMICGALFAAGWNAHGQLAMQQDKEFFDAFERIPCSEIKPACKSLEVICGNWCTILRKQIQM